MLAIERRINGRNRQREHPAWGADVKVLGVRNGSAVRLTVACAMIGCHVFHPDEYFAETASIKGLVQDLAAQHGFSTIETAINAADDRSIGSLYLTVSGTSAEAGDDGQVGRGNRVNGLITPCRPMSLEAAAGKNPVTHVGKIYNVLAREIAAALIAQVPQISAAQCFLVSRIGMPVTSPALMQVKLQTTDEVPASQLRSRVEEIVAAHLSRIPKLTDDFVDGVIEVF